MSFRTDYLTRLKKIGKMSYADFEELYGSYFDNSNDDDFTETELTILGDMNEQFDMTTDMKIGPDDRDLGWISWPEFQEIVETEVLPALEKAAAGLNGGWPHPEGGAV